MTLLVWLIIAVVYIASAFFWYKYTKISHSINGRFDEQDAGIVEFLIMICPVFNTLLCITGWLCFPPKGNSQQWNKFFNIIK